MDNIKAQGQKGVNTTEKLKEATLGDKQTFSGSEFQTVGASKAKLKSKLLYRFMN